MTTERDLLDLLHRRLDIKNGVSPRHIVAEHVRSDPTYGGRIVDALSVDTWGSAGHAITGYEVKTSRSDWLREIAQPGKAEAWRPYCARWYLIAPRDVVRDDLPVGWGHLEPTTSGLALRVRRHAPLRDPLSLDPPRVAALCRAIHHTSARRATAAVAS